MPESSLRTSDFTYDLPEELIAQTPCERRDASRLLMLRKTSGQVAHCQFSDLPQLISAGDRLVFNDTKVFPARLAVHKETGTGLELLFIQKLNERTWNVIARNSGRMKAGAILAIDQNPQIVLKIVKVHEDGSRMVALEDTKECASISMLLDRYGEVPLPPYIRRRPSVQDRTTYQTVYAEKVGAVAAPTAGLHFTQELMQRLAGIGIDFSFVTLHVGIGTFRPVKEQDPRNHVMHTESIEFGEQTVAEIHATKQNGGRVIAVGTTVVRLLEHCAVAKDRLAAAVGQTALKILPGYEFKIIDGVITNFHLPCSTLLMLICAFAGREAVMAAYQSAIDNHYRFFSYGDAMLIL